MYQKERIDMILSILKENGYVTVKYLTKVLGYSTATVNRDLNIMENQKMIRRTYGGVELVENQGVPLAFRYHKMRAAKKQIGKKAAEYICDGDTVFIDGSTTAECVGRFITDRKNLTVITNNMALVSYLCRFDITVICLGGKVVEIPSMLDGLETAQNAAMYHADKMFFSVGAVTKDGKVGGGKTYSQMHWNMARNADKVFLLIDHEKIDQPYEYIKFRFDEIDCVISDYVFDEEVKKEFSDTEFVEI